MRLLRDLLRAGTVRNLLPVLYPVPFAHGSGHAQACDRRADRHVELSQHTGAGYGPSLPIPLVAMAVYPQAHVVRAGQL